MDRGILSIPEEGTNESYDDGLVLEESWIEFLFLFQLYLIHTLEG